MTAKRFREVLENNDILKVPMVHDAMSAKVAEITGYEALAISGYGVSLSKLGLPDAGYLSLPDIADIAGSITSTVDIPVYADIDEGYGNAISARRAVRECILNTNLAGVMIEDQVTPKRCGKMSGKRVLSREEALGKMRAVTDVRDELNEDFIIIGRTDALGAVDGTIDEAIERANLYHDIGADVIFIEAPTSHEQYERIGEEVSADLIFPGSGVGGLTSRLSTEAASDLGFDIYSISATIRPAITSTYDILAGMQEEGISAYTEFEKEHENHPVGDLHEFAGFDEIQELEKEYLPDEEQEKYEKTAGHELTD